MNTEYNYSLAATETVMMYMDKGMISREDKETHTTLLYIINRDEEQDNAGRDEQHGSNDWF